ETLGEGLAERQEIVAALADMTAVLYALESAWLRLRKLGASSNSTLNSQLSTLIYGNDACAQVEQWARYALAGFAAGDTLRTHVSTVRRLMKPPLIDTIALRRELAAEVIAR